MKVTYRWLKEFVDIPWSPEELGEKLTLSGSEVESISPVKSIFENVVIGYISKIKIHPEAKHLKICEVKLKDKNETIICGAPNVKVGQNVVVALPGVTLPAGKTVNIAKIRGMSSNGMICSERELGLSDVGDVILEIHGKQEPGKQFDPGNFSEDYCFDIFINPNRPDCMSVRGLAREIAALSGSKLREKPINLPSSKRLKDNSFKIIINDAEKCPRYAGAIITGVNVRPSPYELQQRISAVGMRPVNNIVDATNYCLIEWGHPLHAFDLNRLEGNQIVVKTAQNKQKFTTLDSESRELNDEVLLICDREKPVAIGGIMGGSNSEIEDDTSDILIECAYFQPHNILRSSKFLGLHTEASHRFGRGMDPNFCIEALKRVCALILRFSPGQLHTPFLDEYPEKINPGKLQLRPERLNKVLGAGFSEELIVNTLNDLEIPSKQAGKVIKSIIPTFRHDLTREIDLVEEVARITGLEKIEPTNHAYIPLRNVKNPDTGSIAKLRNIMTEFGFMEAFTYSMIDRRLEPFFSDMGESIFLTNPISPELSMMRQSLVPGLLNAAKYNINRGIENLRIFEIGSIFSRSLDERKKVRESISVAGVIYGQFVPPSWDHLDTPSDFFTVKGILESIFHKILLDNIKYNSYDSQYMEESGSIILDDKTIGYFGRYKDKSLFVDFDEPLFLFEFETNYIAGYMKKPKYFNPFSKYPPAKRDLAFVIPDILTVQNVMDFIKDVSGPLLKSIIVEDIYRGSQIKYDSRSVKFSFRFNADDHSLNDLEVESLINNIIQSVKNKFNIDIRR